MKLLFFKEVFELLKLKINQCENEIAQLQESKASDTKSSMGDKYETAGEMIQQEIVRWLTLKQQTQTQLQQLEKIQFANTVSDQLVAGSLIQTQKGYFFLGISIGNVKVNGNHIYTLSLQSPLGKAFIGKRKHQKVVFQSHEYEIIDFY